MATFRLDDESWKNLDFPENVWGKKPDYSAEFLIDLEPKIVRVTSLSENKDFRWFYGKFVSFNGNIKLSYPDVILGKQVLDQNQLLEIPNYCFSYYPFLKIVAEGEEFLGWYNYSTGDLLQKEPELIISETDFVDVVTFAAKFNENRLGIR